MTGPHDDPRQGPAGAQRLDVVVVVERYQAWLAMAWHLAHQGLRSVQTQLADRPDLLARLSG
jgi:hypothetical protein